MRNIEVKETDDSGNRVSEKDLSGHLSNPEDGEAVDDDQSAQQDDEEEESSAKLSETDYQLFEALNLLKGLTIANSIQQSQG